MKRISDQTITIQETSEAETTKEIGERKGLNERGVYRFLDELATQGVKIAHCKVKRLKRNGVWQPTDAYFIQD